MASAGISASEDPPRCCICLDEFARPVTLPCGHDFCRTCITKHWDSADKYRCPLCNRCFTSRPELRVRPAESGLTGSAQEAPPPRSGEVQCDVCNETAHKSCLVCLSSYCGTHLGFHQTHALLDPLEGLEEEMCRKFRKAEQKLDNVLSKLSCGTAANKNL